MDLCDGAGVKKCQTQPVHFAIRMTCVLDRNTPGREMKRALRRSASTTRCVGAVEDRRGAANRSRTLSRRIPSRRERRSRARHRRLSGDEQGEELRGIEEAPDRFGTHLLVMVEQPVLDTLEESDAE